MFRQPKTLKTDYIVEQELIKNNFTGRFTHKIQKVKKRPKSVNDSTKRKYNSSWILKYENSFESACSEVIAQEFFRLIHPAQPKYRLLEEFDGINYRYFVLSKEIPNFLSVAHIKAKQLFPKIESGEINGLGRIHVLSLFFSEIDLKFANVGFYKNSLVKIDGDCCFTRLAEGQSYMITEKHLASLPLLENYCAYNWMDYYSEKKLNPHSIFVNSNLSQSVRYRQEVNETILSLLLLPELLITPLIEFSLFNCVRQYDHLTKTQAMAEHKDEIIRQQHHLLIAGMLNSSFCQYLNSPDAELFFKNYLDQLISFKAIGKNKLLNNWTDCEKEMMSTFSKLRHISTNQDYLNEMKNINENFEKINELLNQNKMQTPVVTNVPQAGTLPPKAAAKRKYQEGEDQQKKSKDNHLGVTGLFPPVKKLRTIPVAKRKPAPK